MGEKEGKKEKRENLYEQTKIHKKRHKKKQYWDGYMKKEFAILEESFFCFHHWFPLPQPLKGGWGEEGRGRGGGQMRNEKYVLLLRETPLSSINF